MHPENISIVAGEEIRLGCVVGGRPPPEVRWWRQNGQIPGNRVVVNDNSVLTVRNVVPDDEDVYVCQAENSVGSVQAFANVQIHCKYWSVNIDVKKRQCITKQFASSSANR